MHTILDTDCFVLKSSASGEANKQLDLFTKDFGFIRATAQGLRYLKSKLRYSLTDFSYARVSLVRGKEFWRVTTATKKGDVSFDVVSLEARESLFRIFALLRRLLQGEESHPELFDTVLKAFHVLMEISNEGAEHLAIKVMAVEELTVLRILFLLGYVKDDPSLRTFVDSNEFSDDLIQSSLGSRKALVAEINRALQASSL